MAMHAQPVPSVSPPLPSAQFLQDEAWLQANLAELVRQYPDQWIAVLHGKVITSAPGLVEVERVAAERHPGATPVFWLAERHAGVYAR